MNTLTNLVLTTIKEAGEIARDRIHNPGEVRIKPDGSKVSDTDELLSGHIYKALNRFNYGYLDEERPDQHTRESSKFCWLVDPLDNSAGYLHKGDDWSVIVSLLERNDSGKLEPELAAMYRPITNELVYAEKGNGAWLIEKTTSRRLQVCSPNDSRSIVITRTEGIPELDEMLKKVPHESVERMGGMWKCIEVAKGEFSLYANPPAHGLHLWDIGAAALIVPEAGGTLTDSYGNDYDFNSPSTECNRGLMVSRGPDHAEVIDLINS